jgi:hypothetical protein
METIAEISVIAGILPFEWPFGTTATVLIIIFLIIFSSSVWLASYYIFDTFRAPKRCGSGVIKDKKICHLTEAFDDGDVDLIPAGPGFYEKDECCLLKIEVEKKSRWVMVNENTYHNSREGECINLKYVIGRFTKDIFVCQVS